MSAMGQSGARVHVPGPLHGGVGGRARPAFSLLRAGVPVRLGIVGLVSAVLWLAILWALA